MKPVYIQAKTHNALGQSVATEYFGPFPLRSNAEQAVTVLKNLGTTQYALVDSLPSGGFRGMTWAELLPHLQIDPRPYASLDKAVPVNVSALEAEFRMQDSKSA